jgi:hypothetical protein
MLISVKNKKPHRSRAVGVALVSGKRKKATKDHPTKPQYYFGKENFSPSNSIR